MKSYQQMYNKSIYQAMYHLHSINQQIDISLDNVFKAAWSDCISNFVNAFKRWLC